MTDRFLRLKALAEITGTKVSFWRQRIARRACPIPFKRVGQRMILFRESDIQTWIDSLPVVDQRGADSP